MLSAVTDYLRYGAGCLLGVVFAVAAVSKLRSRRAFTEFVASLRPMGLAPAARLPLVAGAVAVAEVAVTVLLAVSLGGPLPENPASTVAALGFAGAVALLAVLTGGVAVALRRGVSAPCRCFGVSAAPLGPIHLARNGILLVVAAVGLISVLASPLGSGEAAGLAIAVPAGLVLGALIVAFDDLWFLLAPPARRQ